MKKSEVIRMRVTPEEKAMIENCASALGLTASAYMLYKLGEAAGDELGKKIVERTRKKIGSKVEQQEKIPDFD